MRTLIILAMLTIAVLTGAPYAAWVLNRLVGTNATVMPDAAGVMHQVILGPAAPVPDWLPRLPGEGVVMASRWSPGGEMLDEGDLEVLTHKGLDECRDFYRQALQRQGFVLDDPSQPQVDPAIAAWLALDGDLLAHRSATGHQIQVQFRSPQGMILQPRLIQIHFRQRITSSINR